MRIYVDRYTYSVDGARSESFDIYEQNVLGNLGTQVEVYACACTEVNRITSLIGWLVKLDAGPPKLTTVFDRGVKGCLECDQLRTEITGDAEE